MTEPIRRSLPQRLLQPLTRLSTEARWITAAIVTLVGCTVVLLGVGEDVIRRNGAYHDDRPWLGWVVRHRGLRLEEISRALAVVGSVGVLLVLAVAVAVVLWWRGLRLAHCAAPLVALLGAGFAVSVLKSAVGRVRPLPPIRLITDNEASFPSGHSADSTALFVTLALVIAVTTLRRPLHRVLLVSAAALLSGSIAASRLVLGVHWPTDVIAGLALGLAAAVTAIVLATLLTGASGERTSRRAIRRLLQTAQRRRSGGGATADRATSMRQVPAGLGSSAVTPLA